MTHTGFNGGQSGSVLSGHRLQRVVSYLLIANWKTYISANWIISLIPGMEGIRTSAVWQIISQWLVFPWRSRTTYSRVFLYHQCSHKLSPNSMDRSVIGFLAITTSMIWLCSFFFQQVQIVRPKTRWTIPIKLCRFLLSNAVKTRWSDIAVRKT